MDTGRLAACDGEVKRPLSGLPSRGPDDVVDHPDRPALQPHRRDSSFAHRLADRDGCRPAGESGLHETSLWNQTDDITVRGMRNSELSEKASTLERRS